MKEAVLNKIRENLKTDICGDGKIIESGIDSFVMITLMVELEKEFSIEIDDDDLDYNKYETFNDLVEMVERKIEECKLSL